jgi:predicted RND superfamily exporter protein
MHGDDQAWYRLPAERELAAQYLLLYEMSLPYGLDLNNQINIDKSATRMTVMLYNMTTRTVLQLEQRAQRWLRDNLPSSMHNEGASPTIMFSNIGERNIKSMLLGTTVALMLISLILVFALRSFKIGLLSLIPNLIPAALAFGAWGILVGQIGLALSVVTGMTLGIVVDDTVHFLSKYLRARREKGLDAQDAVRYAFSTVGLALVVTSIVLVAGFTVLTFSAFALNSNMAIMTAVTIIFAIVADFLLLPPILMALDSKSHGNSETGEQPIAAFESKEQINV